MGTAMRRPFTFLCVVLVALTAVRCCQCASPASEEALSQLVGDGDDPEQMQSLLNWAIGAQSTGLPILRLRRCTEQYTKLTGLR